MNTTGNAIVDSITANSEWVDSLLNLFWTVDKVIAGNEGLADEDREHIPEAILAAWDNAETARKEL